MINKIIAEIQKVGGSPYFVGGCVRDELLGLTPKDIDIEVFKITSEDLVKVLSEFGKVDQVGVSFGVIKLTTEDQDYDFTLPRRDNKVAVGHKGFIVEVDPHMSEKEAAARRDFTINSISAHGDGYYIDPFDGIEDLNNKILRATSDHFVEDPLRVLRGFQFCGRFELTADVYTSIMCEALILEYKTLAVDRIHSEWKKWALKSTKPSMGLEFLRKCGWINLYPELKALINCPQDPEWHPEGDVWQHTLHVVDAAAEIATRDHLNDQDRLELIFGALCHDMGKPTTTILRDGRWRSPGHDAEGVAPTISFMKSIGFVGNSELGKVVDKVARLTYCHMDHIGVIPNERFVKRLSVRVAPSNILQLVRVMEADHSGRPPLPKKRPDTCNEILVYAGKLMVEEGKPVPIVMGRHLIEAGLKPSKRFKEILNIAYDMQLEELFSDLPSAMKLLEEGGYFNLFTVSTIDRCSNGELEPCRCPMH